MSELIIASELNAVAVFKDGGLDKVLEKITKEVESVLPDLTTDKGRKAVASLARKVATSKIALDNAGKKLVAEWKNNSKLVDVERKKSRDYLDVLRDKIRCPLTEWEEAEEKRIKAEALVIEINDCHAKALDIEAIRAKQEEMAAKEAELAARIQAMEDKEAEQERKSQEVRDLAEKARRKKQEDADRIDRERAAKEMQKKRDEQARKDAEREANERIEIAEKEAQEKIEQAEQDAKDKIAAAERERQEQEDNERQAQEKREANKRHRGKINREAVESLVAVGFDEKESKAIVTAIAKGEIKNVTINY